jgi:acylphosphatase
MKLKLYFFIFFLFIKFVRMKNELKQLNIRVFGSVQGVWFRKSVKEQATRIGISGIVMNEPDGSVFIIAKGLKDQLDEFISYCAHGPELAEVINIHIEEEEVKQFEGFKII